MKNLWPLLKYELSAKFISIQNHAYFFRESKKKIKTSNKLTHYFIGLVFNFLNVMLIYFLDNQ